MGNAWTNQIYVKPYSYKGCYKDNESRMVPQYTGDVTSLAACKAKAFSLKMNTFSLQFGGQCFVGNSPNYEKLGVETNTGNCGSLGGTWSNQVYSMN
jgi:hypothetical protein